MGNEVTECCLNLLNNILDLKDLNETMIMMIPKIKAPLRVSDFRPISFCNVCYKIISKVLVNKLKKVLDKIISPYQSVFIPKRHITDNAILGFECIHSLRNKKSRNSAWAALKLDMSKAYDRGGVEVP